MAGQHHHRKKHTIAEPGRVRFDPWNCVSSGHQTAENRYAASLDWRSLRTNRLNSQLGRSVQATKATATTATHSSQHYNQASWPASLRQQIEDERKKNHNERGRDNIAQYKKRRKTSSTMEQDMRFAPAKSDDQTDRTNSTSDHGSSGSLESVRSDSNGTDSSLQALHHDTGVKGPSLVTSKTLQLSTGGDSGALPRSDLSKASQEKPESQLFANCTFYVNGCTLPLISDHGLKRLIVKHGGDVSLSLLRRKVTHVVVSKRSNGRIGMAGSKVQYENQKLRGNGIRYVEAEWILESIIRGKRLLRVESNGNTANNFTPASRATAFEP